MKFVRSFNNIEYNCYLIETDQDADDVRMFDHLERASEIVLDIETGGLWFYADPLAGIAIYLPEKRYVYYISVGHAGNCVTDKTMRVLRDLLTDTNKIYHLWNAKFDLKFLQRYGFPYLEKCPPVFDVMVALHLLDENRYQKGKNYRLKDVSAEYVNPSAADESEALDHLLKQRGLQKSDLHKLSAAEVAAYAMQDVILTWELWSYFIPYLKAWNLLNLYAEQNEFMIKALMRMEYCGIPVDRNLIVSHISKSQMTADNLLKELQSSYGESFNPNSPVQVAAVLNVENAQKRTLQKLSDHAAQNILDYKFALKSTNTFYEPYLKYSSHDGRLHPDIHIIGTVSGRLSSSNPNLQQVPRKSKGERGYQVKDVFVAPEGYSFVQFDYKQLELRLACHFAGEDKMTKMFEENIDLHQYTADSLKVNRHTGKSLNFGLLYGMGAERAAEFLDIPIEEARKLVPRWRKLYPAFMNAAQSLYEQARSWRDRDGNAAAPGKGWKYIRLPDGRVRRYNYPNANEFTAWNTLVQGTGAIITRRALLKIADAFPYPNSDVEFALTVHDSVLLIVKDEKLPEVISTVKSLMEDFPEFRPGMEVDTQVGKSWGDMK